MSELENFYDPRMHSGRFYAHWDIVAHRPDTGEIVAEEHGENLIVDTGREDALYLLFGLAGSAVLTALGAGASSTAADHTQTRLIYELVGNSTRIPLTNSSGGPIIAGNVASETFVDGLGNTYYRKLVVQGIYPTGDGNNGQPFQEYGLFTTVTKPANPTATSGVMFNRFVAGSAIIKDASTQITVNITIRV